MAPFEAEHLFEAESARQERLAHDHGGAVATDAPTATFSLRAWFAAQFFGRSSEQRCQLPENKFASGPLHHNGCQ